MNRIAIAFSALALMTMPAYAQQPQAQCGLTEATSPSVRGVRLGMSTEQLLALFPANARRRDFKDALERVKTASSDETARLSIDPMIDASGDTSAGAVAVGLTKGRVTDFTISYVGPTWRNVDEWVAKLTESLKLPAGRTWTVGPNENPNKILRCNGIEIEAAIQGGGGSITIRNTEQVKVGEQRRDAGEEKKRREFKP
ncbi:MAG TPA: hypothetical protein VGV87_17110 [Blastocatellia bacterium]|jgi:hypothetical protein|nr:hypothetical protein [Blastocatellia bacterium]